MRISTTNANRWMGATGQGTGYFTGWSVDSRTVERGDLFFALRGPTHDGHNHLREVWARGAAAVVDRAVETKGPAFLVDDTLRALQRLARHARRAWGGRVVGVTGSAGKTTTKDVIAHFLTTQIPTGKTIGNFNNHVGLPLSVLRLPEECRVAVLEIGMNHAGEIRELCTIAEPDVAVVTNVGYAHIEFFHSIDGIALAKRELVESLSASGVAVLNADDERVARFGEIHRGRTITYGFGENADVRGFDLELAGEGTCFRCGGVEFRTPLTGRHGALNVLAGIATAAAFEIEAQELVEAAKTIPIGKMRGERFDQNGFTILNDSYNANPEAMKAMLDVLATTNARRRVAVLGEMLELGEQSEALHRAVGAHVVQDRVDLLVGIRGTARAMVDEATRSGMPSSATLFFDDPVQAGHALKQILQPGDAILFKGSRGVRVERALETLLEDHG